MIINTAATWWPLSVGVVGLFIGSYLNVVALRWFDPQKSAQKLSSRSECANCHRQLGWLELIPLVSFIVLRRRCKGCQALISWRYPLVELLTGVVFYLIAFNFHGFWQLFTLLILSSVMIVIALIDLVTQLIPDRLTYPMMGIFAVVLISTGNNNLLDFYKSQINIYHWLIGLVIGLAIPFLIVALTKGRGMGIGDIKLGGLIGLTLGGAYCLVAMFSAFVIGALVGLGLVAKNKANLKTQLPFGPFLVLGWLIALFWGPRIVAWYTGFTYF